ncbi:hypothetical protein D3C80_1203570 [compost metagenome]
MALQVRGRVFLSEARHASVGQGVGKGRPLAQALQHEVDRAVQHRLEAGDGTSGAGGAQGLYHRRAAADRGRPGHAGAVGRSQGLQAAGIARHRLLVGADHVAAGLQRATDQGVADLAFRQGLQHQIRLLGEPGVDVIGEQIGGCIHIALLARIANQDADHLIAPVGQQTVQQAAADHAASGQGDAQPRFRLNRAGRGPALADHRALGAAQGGHLDLHAARLAQVDGVVLDQGPAQKARRLPAGAAIAQRRTRFRSRIAVVEAVHVLHQTHPVQTQFGRQNHRRQVRSAPAQQGHPAIGTHTAEARHHHHLMLG